MTAQEGSVKHSIERLLSQQSLDKRVGIQVRLSSENQVFLNTRRPTRVGIPATLLEKVVAGFIPRRPMFLKTTYLEPGAVSYHRYVGGSSWVPTAPSSIGRAGAIFTLRVEPLNEKKFLTSFPKIGLGSKRRLAWMADWALVTVVKEDESVSLKIEQAPPIEGISTYTIKGRVVGGLTFHTASIFATFEMTDAFSVPRRLLLHHDGHRKAWLARQTSKSFKLRLFSFDGIRLRMIYRNGKRSYSTAIYLEEPSQIYALGETTDFPICVEAGGIDKKFCVENTSLLRPTERAIVKHGNYYENGRVGAEISYAIVRRILGVDNLLLNEPAKGGTDLYTQDRKILVESRLIADTKPSRLWDQISLDLAKMTRKLRTDFRCNPGAEIGYIVLSYVNRGRLNSLVAALGSPR